MILAGIDIGTNTLRLLVAEAGPESLHEITADRKVTRLGQDLDLNGMLTDEAQDRTLMALADFAETIRMHSAIQTSAIGTSALRNASNSSAFIQAAKRRTGIDITVVSGEEEAHLTLLGVAHALQGERTTPSIGSLPLSLVVDIGGGSTEMISTHQGGRQASVSLPLGAVYLTERVIKHDPPTVEEVAMIRRIVREQLERAAATIQPDRSGILVGTAGTITTLAAMDLVLDEYDPKRINGSVLSAASLDTMIGLLSTRSLEERRKISGLEPGREDIILAGAVILQEIIQRFGYASILVSDWGLREGILLDMYRKIASTGGTAETMQ